MPSPNRLASSSFSGSVPSPPLLPVASPRACSGSRARVKPNGAPAPSGASAASLWDRSVSFAIRLLLSLARWLSGSLSNPQAGPTFATSGSAPKARTQGTQTSSSPIFETRNLGVGVASRGRSLTRIDSALAHPGRSSSPPHSARGQTHGFPSPGQATSPASLRSPKENLDDPEEGQNAKLFRESLRKLSAHYSAFRESADIQLAEAQQETYQVSDSLKQAEARSERLSGRLRQLEEELEQARLETQMVQEELSELRARPAEILRTSPVLTDLTRHQSLDGSGDAQIPFARVRPPHTHKPWRP